MQMFITKMPSSGLKSLSSEATSRYVTTDHYIHLERTMPGNGDTPEWFMNTYYVKRNDPTNIDVFVDVNVVAKLGRSFDYLLDADKDTLRVAQPTIWTLATSGIDDVYLVRETDPELNEPSWFVYTTIEHVYEDDFQGHRTAQEAFLQSSKAVSGAKYVEAGCYAIFKEQSEHGKQWLRSIAAGILEGVDFALRMEERRAKKELDGLLEEFFVGPEDIPMTQVSLRKPDLFRIFERR